MFPPLPGVPQELRAIIRDPANGQTPAAGDGVLEGRVLLDESFTKEALRAALADHYPLIHIASHFRFQPGNESDSFLLLGGADEQGSKLTIPELKRLSFEGVNLLTLSACETALGGEKANGVEVESFGVIAQRQGAQAIMATLWPVADESTPLLMREFYRLREANPGMTKAAALHRAQLALLTGAIKAANAGAGRRGIAPDIALPPTSFTHPYYWAPFILIGNWL
jgi:CHAT domain-containing protein